MADAKENLVGAYLRDRRAKLDPAALGYPLTRRRTPGLRREEVAQRAHVSATWYTWIEQGRGGAPSPEVLNRIAHALMLTDAEREHLFLLALGRTPEVQYGAAHGVTPRLQHLLDSLDLSPAYIKTSTWDIVAWNRAATAVLADYGALSAAQRNILRLIFSNSSMRQRPTDWESVARFVVASFRADTARAGAARNAKSLVDELCQLSPEFDSLWRDNDVGSSYGEITKHVRHPQAGLIALEYSSFSVDGRPDLGLVIYHPATAEDAERIRSLLYPVAKVRKSLKLVKRAGSRTALRRAG